MQARQDNYELERERNTWRRAFYTVCAILFALTVGLLILAGSMLIKLN